MTKENARDWSDLWKRTAKLYRQKWLGRRRKIELQRKSLAQLERSNQSRQKTIVSLRVDEQRLHDLEIALDENRLMAAQAQRATGAAMAERDELLELCKRAVTIVALLTPFEWGEMSQVLRMAIRGTGDMADAFRAELHDAIDRVEGDAGE